MTRFLVLFLDFHPKKAALRSVVGLHMSTLLIVLLELPVILPGSLVVTGDLPQEST